MQLVASINWELLQFVGISLLHEYVVNIRPFYAVYRFPWTFSFGRSDV
ncbi:hypothetical protein [Bacillus glycinifermentans]|uniref:Uncharacterized protein n=1 Tax=Bacillus glycinifermentans TaxID=1664069 RepID=A0ABU6H7S4_9BACI|nr:hypothetical protein [Bacillus glycinifermentans]MEC0486744.1 hypothetical protein [Bacillus glycinifermentans]MEC0493854.1 hypothetical protein [Bacillus glycinifermentans]MEC0543323.1 hypothetical protein [Bacillus glycinifermentans]MEC3606444.1 hypothetical protein [Bacillus glycinifermentans]UOY88397.1 hypothetical protein MW696_20710 [Bacillus glycinifermentans]